MNIFILGLPGTGKTTLSKRLAGTLGMKYISDFEVVGVAQGMLTHFDMICHDHFEEIKEYLLSHSEDDFVFDLDYSVPPEKVRELPGDKLIYYLGFAGADPVVLSEKMQGEKDNFPAPYEDFINLLISSSNLFKSLCEKNQIRFITINSEKNAIIEKLQNEIIADYEKILK